MEIAKLKRMYLLGREAYKESAKKLARKKISDKDYTFNWILHVFSTEIKGVAVTSDGSLTAPNLYPVFLLPIIKSLALLKLIDQDYFPGEAYKLFKLIKESKTEMTGEERIAFNKEVLSIAAPYGYDNFTIDDFLSSPLSPFTLKLKEDKDYSSLVKLAFPSSDVIKTYEIGEIYSRVAIPGINLGEEPNSKLKPLYTGEAFLNEALAFLEKHHDHNKELGDLKLNYLIKEDNEYKGDDGGFKSLENLMLSVGKEKDIFGFAYETMIIIYGSLAILRKLNAIKLLPLSLPTIGTALTDSFYQTTIMEPSNDYKKDKENALYGDVEKEEAYIKTLMYLSLKELAPIDPSFQELFDKNQGLLDKAYYYYYNQKTKLTKPEFEETLKSVDDIFLEKDIDFTKAFFNIRMFGKELRQENQHRVLDILNYSTSSFEPLYGIDKDKHFIETLRKFFYWYHVFALAMSSKTVLLTIMPRNHVQSMKFGLASDLFLEKRKEKEKEQKQNGNSKDKSNNK